MGVRCTYFVLGSINIFLLGLVVIYVGWTQARGHHVAAVDPLGINYADLHDAFNDRKGTPPELVVRNYMLGKGLFEGKDVPRNIVGKQVSVPTHKNKLLLLEGAALWCFG